MIIITLMSFSVLYWLHCLFILRRILTSRCVIDATEVMCQKSHRWRSVDEAALGRRNPAAHSGEREAEGGREVDGLYSSGCAHTWVHYRSGAERSSSARQPSFITTPQRNLIPNLSSIASLFFLSFFLHFFVWRWLISTRELRQAHFPREAPHLTHPSESSVEAKEGARRTAEDHALSGRAEALLPGTAQGCPAALQDVHDRRDPVQRDVWLLWETLPLLGVSVAHRSAEASSLMFR